MTMNSRSRIPALLIALVGWKQMASAAPETVVVETPAGPKVGYSAAYYGITDPVMQRASLRAVLEDHGLDNPQPAPSLVAASTYLLLKMFTGGGGAPTDIVEPRKDVKEYIEQRLRPEQKR